MTTQAGGMNSTSVTVVTLASGQKSRVQFSLKANYTSVVANNKSAFISHVKPQIATKLGVELNRIVNMDATQGQL